MKTRNTLFVLFLMILVLIITGCGASATATPTAKPLVAVSPTVPPPPTEPPTSTPVPPTPVPPTSTPVPPQATTKQQLNVRQGPGTQFAIAGKMPAGTSAVILGKNDNAQWFQVAYPDAQHPGWIASTFVTVTGTIDQLPVVAVAPPPTVTPGGPAPAKAAAATPTQTFPPPKGSLSFITYDPAQSAYVLNNLDVASHAFGADRLLGPKPGPADVRLSTNDALFAWSTVTPRLAYVSSADGQVDKLNVTLGDPAQSVMPNIQISHGGANVGSQLREGGISSPSWSPDGSTIAFIGMDNNYATQIIYTIPSGGGVQTKFFQARSGENFRGLAWGKTHLLFVSNLSGSPEIWRLNSDGSGPLQLTSDKRENGSPEWSPDGSKFAYYSRQADGSYQIMAANSDGTGAHKLTSTSNNFTPTWSPDGNWIAFASTRGGRLDVYIMDKNGGHVQLVTDKSPLEAFLPGSWR